MLSQRGRPERRQTRWIRLRGPELTASHCGVRFMRGKSCCIISLVFQYEGLRMNKTLPRVSVISKQTEQTQSVRCQDGLCCEMTLWSEARQQNTEGKRLKGLVRRVTSSKRRSTGSRSIIFSLFAYRITCMFSNFPSNM